MSASHFKLENLTVILDNNNLDSDCDIRISNFIKKVLKNEI